ncbi:MAG: efflux transporter outer membrane subunit [Alistipes sp.]|nr:efflux transporter outer membrane subunit [Alistipes sp.]
MRRALRYLMSAVVSAVVVVWAGCSAVRECKEPELNLPESIAGMDADSMTIADVGWWEFYGDADLRYIIERTLEHNKKVLAAAARVEQLRELYRIGKANRLPNLNFVAPFNNETNDYWQESPLRDPEFGLKFSIRWELDFWGNLRWAKRKAGAEYEATIEDERAVRMMLVAEAASAYFRLVALDNELEIVRRTMNTRLEGVEMARIRFEGGVTNEIVYRQAQMEYAMVATRIPDLEYGIQVLENALALLMGEYPDLEISRSGGLQDDDLPERLPVGVPSVLLQRRPDVRASEQRLKASMAAVGVAYADRFPRMIIDLTGGVEDNGLRGLLRSPFSYIAETLTAPIFGFGRKRAKYKASIAAYDEARFNYEQKVLEVFKEADDAVAYCESTRSASALRERQLNAAREYDRLTHSQFTAGSIRYLDVLDAQRRYLEAQIGMNNAIRDEHLALVQLYKVLGGGWQIEDSGDEK